MIVRPEKRPLHYHSERGIALLIVLFSVVLVAVMVISFLLLAESDSNSSELHRDGLRSRQLADIALQIGQRDEGCQQPGIEPGPAEFHSPAPYVSKIRRRKRSPASNRALACSQVWSEPQWPSMRRHRERA